MFKEDTVQIPTQKSRIPSFFLDDPVMRPDAHQCPEVSNRSRLHPSGCCGNVSVRSSEFNKKSDFLLKQRYGKTAASVRMTGQHRSDAILDKARCGEELQPSRRQGNTVRTQSLLWYLRAEKVQPFARGPDMVLREAYSGKPVAQLSIRTASV